MPNFWDQLDSRFHTRKGSLIIQLSPYPLGEGTTKSKSLGRNSPKKGKEAPVNPTTGKPGKKEKDKEGTGLTVGGNPRLRSSGRGERTIRIQ
jgi:hypothetical protein